MLTGSPGLFIEVQPRLVPLGQQTYCPIYDIGKNTACEKELECVAMIDLMDVLIAMDICKTETTSPRDLSCSRVHKGLLVRMNEMKSVSCLCHTCELRCDSCL